MEIILGLLFLVGLAMAKQHGPTVHPTGLKPEPEPEPQPHHEPPVYHPPSVTPHGGGPAKKEPQWEVKIGPATIEPEAHALPAATPAVPVAWPQAVPKELPPWPAGWEPDTPVPAAELTRAKQILPELWKGGKAGKYKTEQTAGKWVTYLAFVPSKGKKGVAAFRVKPGAQGASSVQV